MSHFHQIKCNLFLAASLDVFGSPRDKNLLGKPRIVDLDYPWVKPFLSALQAAGRSALRPRLGGQGAVPGGRAARAHDAGVLSLFCDINRHIGLFLISHNRP